MNNLDLFRSSNKLGFQKEKLSPFLFPLSRAIRNEKAIKEETWGRMLKFSNKCVWCRFHLSGSSNGSRTHLWGPNPWGKKILSLLQTNATLMLSADEKILIKTLYLREFSSLSESWPVGRIWGNGKGKLPAKLNQEVAGLGSSFTSNRISVAQGLRSDGPSTRLMEVT